MSHKVEILSVGTELLLGSIANTDAQMLSQGLSALGLNVFWHTVVGDNPQRAREAVELARSRADIIITTGGLGPTCDDLTKNVLAEAFGKKLVYHQESLERIKDYARVTGRPLTENNFQQALVPEGSTVLVNDWGSAPGCAFEADGVHVIMLPGPPSECRPMFHHRAVPYLQALSEGVIASHTLKLFGIGESAMEAQLRDEMNAMSNPTLAPYAKEGECELRVTAKAPTQEEAQALLLPKVEELKARFGALVYGVDVPSLEYVVLEELKARGLTLGAAESCTGGMIASKIVNVAGASEVFNQGFVTYSNKAKRKMVGVGKNTLKKYGAVSEPTAREMAAGGAEEADAEAAVAVTGIAGPDGGTDEKPVGLVYIACCLNGDVTVEECHFHGSRTEIREQSAMEALDLLRRCILKYCG